MDMPTLHQVVHYRVNYRGTEHEYTPVHACCVRFWTQRHEREDENEAEEDDGCDIGGKTSSTQVELGREEWFATFPLHNSTIFSSASTCFRTLRSNIVTSAVLHAMGAEASKPQVGVPFQVIGAGLSRTGTSSFNTALSILLRGLAHHGGTQIVLGSTNVMSSWLKMFAHWPSSRPEDKAIVHHIIKQQLDGYVGATDLPIHGIVEDVLEVYPNAKVICTVRDPEPWTKSMNALKGVCQMLFLRFALLPLGGGKWRFPDFIEALIRMWQHQYGHGTGVEHYRNHIAYLKRVVPQDQLFFFDVKDGWEPLCKILGKEVPDISFPRVNDSKATEELAQKMVVKGLKCWTVIFTALAVGTVGVWYGR